MKIVYVKFFYLIIVLGLFLVSLSSVAQVIKSSNDAYMIVSSGVIKADKLLNNGSIINNGQLIILDSLSNAGTTSGSGIYKISRYFNNTGVFIKDLSTVDFSGAIDQTIPSLSFHNLTISGGSRKILNADTYVAGSLDLTSGFVIASSTNKLILTKGANILNGSKNSFVDGELRKIGDMDTPLGFTFHVGAYISAGDMKYKKINLSELSTPYNSNADENFFTVHFHYFPGSDWIDKNDKRNNKITNDRKVGTKIKDLGTIAYWEIERQGGNSQSNATVNITYYWDASNPLLLSLADTKTLSIGHYDNPIGDSGKWEDARETNRSVSERLTKGTNTSGFITITKVSSFSPFSEASTTDAAGALGPLPVELINFTAKVTPEKKVALNWATASESVNKGFRIERQNIEYGNKFEKIGFVDSKASGGNSQIILYYNFLDNNPKPSIANYYRLVQEDIDGKLTYSEVRMIRIGAQSVSMVFPNPSSGGITISRTADDKKMNIQIIDLSGRVVKEYYNISESYYKFNITQPGVYNIKMTYPETGEQSIQRVVVQR